MDGLAFGLDGEIIFLHKYGKGWYDLQIPKKYKTTTNYEMYCYLNYCSMDADALFIEKIKELYDKNIPTIQQS